MEQQVISRNKHSNDPKTHRKSVRRERRITVYLTETEFEQVRQLAEADGDGPGGYARRRLMAALGPVAEAQPGAVRRASDAARPAATRPTPGCVGSSDDLSAV